MFQAKIILCMSAAVIASASVAECASSHGNHVNHKSDSSHLKNQGRFFINGPQTLSNYKLVTKGNEGQMLYYNAAPTGYVNFTDSQTQTVAALGNAALFLGSLFLLGSLPARVLGINGRSDYDDYDGELGHRQGLLAGGGPKASSLFKLPKLKLRNPFARSKKRQLKRRLRRPFGGMRRLKKKSGKAGPIREFTYRKKSFGKFLGGPSCYAYALIDFFGGGSRRGEWHGILGSRFGIPLRPVQTISL